MLRAQSPVKAAQLLASSAVAVSHTGDTNETTLVTVTIPAGVMGTNGGLEVVSSWSCTNNANSKIVRARLAGLAGTAYLQLALGAVLSFADRRKIKNRNSASSQVGSSAVNASNPFSATATVLPTSSIDTSAATTLVFTGQLGNAADTVTLEMYEVWLLPA